MTRQHRQLYDIAIKHTSNVHARENCWSHGHNACHPEQCLSMRAGQHSRKAEEAYYTTRSSSKKALAIHVSRNTYCRALGFDIGFVRLPLELKPTCYRGAVRPVALMPEDPEFDEETGESYSLIHGGSGWENAPPSLDQNRWVVSLP